MHKHKIVMLGTGYITKETTSFTGQTTFYAKSAYDVNRSNSHYDVFRITAVMKGLRFGSIGTKQLQTKLLLFR